MYDLVNISLYYDSDYSEYYENVLVTGKDFEKYFGEIDDFEGEEIFVGELDGKHSECLGTIEVTTYNFSDLVTDPTEHVVMDGTYLREYLTESLSMDDRNKVFADIAGHVREELSKLDLKVNLGDFQVKKSQQVLVRRIVELFAGDKVSGTTVNRLKELSDEKLLEAINKIVNTNEN